MVTESIFDGKTFVIPMAGILTIEKLNPNVCPPFSYRVIMAGTTYNHKAGDYNNDILLQKGEGDSLIGAWCKYLYEMEKSFMETEATTESSITVDDPGILTSSLETVTNIHVENINVNFTEK